MISSTAFLMTLWRTLPTPIGLTKDLFKAISPQTMTPVSPLGSTWVKQSLLATWATAQHSSFNALPMKNISSTLLCQGSFRACCHMHNCLSWGHSRFLQRCSGCGSSSGLSMHCCLEGCFSSRCFSASDYQVGGCLVAVTDCFPQLSV